MIFIYFVRVKSLEDPLENDLVIELEVVVDEGDEVHLLHLVELGGVAAVVSHQTQHVLKVKLQTNFRNIRA